MNRQVRISFHIMAVSICLTVTESSNFRRTDLCDANTRLADKCMGEVSRSESVVKCCVRCDQDDDCIGASLQINTSSCYLHFPCSSVSGCAQLDSGFRYFKKIIAPLPCIRGTWNETTESCTCIYDYIGKLCERAPYNCSEFAQSWPLVTGSSMVQLRPLSMTKDIVVICLKLVASSLLQTIVLRNTGELDYNRTWKDYIKGFSSPQPPFTLSFFPGLEAMRLLMGSNPRNLTIKFATKDKTVATVLDKYYGVVMGDSSTQYMLRFASDTQGSCLELSNMTSFSTWDSDNDGDKNENWASRAGAGGWFPATNFTCNLLGHFYNASAPLKSDDAYVRFPGVSNDVIRNSLTRIDLVIEEDYV